MFSNPRTYVLTALIKNRSFSTLRNRRVALCGEMGAQGIEVEAGAFGEGLATSEHVEARSSTPVGSVMFTDGSC